MLEGTTTITTIPLQVFHQYQTALHTNARIIKQPLAMLALFNNMMILTVTQHGTQLQDTRKTQQLIHSLKRKLMHLLNLFQHATLTNIMRKNARLRLLLHH